MIRISIWCDSPKVLQTATELFSFITKSKQQISIGNESFYRFKFNDLTYFDFISPKSISMQRQLLLRKQGVAKMVHIDIGEESLPSGDISIKKFKRDLSVSNIVFQDIPKYFPKVVFHEPITSIIDQPLLNHTLELAIGVGEDEKQISKILNTFYSTSKSVGPNIFQISSNTIIRILPSSFSSIIFNVNDEFDDYLNKSIENRMYGGGIGATSSRRGQIHLTKSNLKGLDVRLTHEKQIQNVFFESNESTFENASDFNEQIQKDISCRGVTGLELRFRMFKFWSNLGRS